MCLKPFNQIFINVPQIHVGGGRGGVVGVDPGDFASDAIRALIELGIDL